MDIYLTASQFGKYPGLATSTSVNNCKKQIITPKLSMLMHTRKGTTLVTQQEKVTNETQQQMNNLFRTLCSVRSFYCRESIFSYMRRAVLILSQANFYSIHFLKVRHFAGKIDNKPLPGVFLEAALPLQ